MMGEHSRPPIPMGPVIARELEILGSHGVAAREYPAMLALITGGRLAPERLVARTITLGDVPAALPRMGKFEHTGITVIDRF
jgi:alcohol dehydrogenase